MHGFGVLYLANGDFCQGEFIKNVRCENATLIKKNGVEVEEYPEGVEKWGYLGRFETEESEDSDK